VVISRAQLILQMSVGARVNTSRQYHPHFGEIEQRLRRARSRAVRTNGKCRVSHNSDPTFLKARCNGDSLRAGKSSWQVDYRVSDLQLDSKVARFSARGRAIRVSE
jgi:Tfp pilus assembly protein FimT